MFVDEWGETVAVEEDAVAIVVDVYGYPMRSRLRVIVRVGDDSSGSRPATRDAIGREDSFRLC